MKFASPVVAVAVAVAAAGFLVSHAAAQDDIADIRSQDVRVGKDENKRYFRIGPKGKARKGRSRKPHGLVILMPGGNGSADFHAFCKRIYKNAVPDDYVAVQPVAVKWNVKQQIVWPKAKDKVKGKKFSTEQFVEEIIDDVFADAGQWVAIDPQRIFVLCWSSSGPAAYSLSLTKNSSPTGYFMAMSVFSETWLPSLKRAKGKAYFIYHSKEDKRCPYRLAKQAETKLGKKGAKVEFRDYPGGHGWRGPLYRNIADGLKWLEKNHAKPSKKKRMPRKKSRSKSKVRRGPEKTGFVPPIRVHRRGVRPRRQMIRRLLANLARHCVILGEQVTSLRRFVCSEIAE